MYTVLTKDYIFYIFWLNLMKFFFFIGIYKVLKTGRHLVLKVKIKMGVRGKSYKPMSHTNKFFIIKMQTSKTTKLANSIKKNLDLFFLHM